MKLLAALAGASLTALVQAAISQASVYTFDADPGPSIAGRTSPSIPPEAARLVLAHRLGLAQYHSLHNADETTIQYLNRFGGRQKQLLPSYEPERPIGKLLVLVEGVEDPAKIFDSNDATLAFTISSPPSSSANLQLSIDLLAQDRHQRANDNACVFDIPSGSEFFGGLNGGRDDFGECNLQDYYTNIGGKGDALEKLRSFEFVIGQGQYGFGSGDATAIFHVSSPGMIAGEEGTNSDRYQESIESLKMAFRSLKDHAASQESTIVLMPLAQKAAKHTSNPYGVDEIPSKSIQARQQPFEEPLSTAPVPEVSSSSPQTPQPSQLQALKGSVLPQGILPICHSDKASCDSTTNNCAGHGECMLKYTTGSGKDLNSTCYACKCGNTTRVNADGTIKTTMWGGPACQKKDVSSPFLLIAGFTVVMVATVAWGIGLMFSIGQEELPSVIGAGVAGPRAQAK